MTQLKIDAALNAMLETRLPFQTTLNPIEKAFILEAANRIKPPDSIANFIRDAAIQRAARLTRIDFEQFSIDFTKSFKR